MVATFVMFSAMTRPLVLAVGLLGDAHPAELPGSVAVLDIDSGTTPPPGNYRWMNAADQLYSANYPESTVGVFGEWERLPVGGVTHPLGDSPSR